MLNAILVSNFKAFAEQQRIPIRPLTLIFGANSSGKSSILHSLLLAHHALETGDLDVHRTTVGGDSVDLGGFRQYVHRHDVSQKVGWTAEFDTSSFSKTQDESISPVRNIAVTFSLGIALDDKGQPFMETVPQIQTYEIAGDMKSLMRMSSRQNLLNLDFIELSHPFFSSLIKRRFASVFEKKRLGFDYHGLLLAAVDKALQYLVVEKGKLLPEKLRFNVDGNKELASFTIQAFQTFATFRKTPEFSALQRYIKSLLPESLETPILNDLEFAIRGFLEIISDFMSIVSNDLQQELARLTYLGPLRSYPPRHLAFSTHNDPNWSAGGGFAWDEISRNPEVRKHVNAWLSQPDRLHTRYELVVRQLVDIGQLEKPLIEAFQKINEDSFTLVRSSEESTREMPPVNIGEPELQAKMFRESIQSSEIEKISELIMIDRRSNTIVSHRDVGIGVSQVIPVLVRAYASKNRIIAIEQPEIHLHPALQADLGDVFIQSALGEGQNRFLLETHSEHLLLRIMRRMRETNQGKLPEGIPKVTPHDVSVLFVEPDGKRSIIREMPLNENGELVKAWPGGFFEEGLREVF